MSSSQLNDLLQRTSPYGNPGVSDIRTNSDFDMNKATMELENKCEVSNVQLDNTGMHIADDQDSNSSKTEQKDQGLENCANNVTKDIFIPEHFLYTNESLKIEKENEMDNNESDSTEMHIAYDQNPNISRTNGSDRGLQNYVNTGANGAFYIPENYHHSNEGLIAADTPTHKLYTRTLCAFGKDDFTCNVCNKTFKDKRDVIRHIRIHTGEKPYKCNQCGFSFGCEYNLKRHIETHKGEKPFPCNICHRHFARKEYLQQHILLHSDDSEKPFPCHICGKGYVKRSYLERHLKTHVKVLEFFCSICGEGFYESRGLVSHMSRLHSGSRPFPCSVCKQEFRKEHLLKKHMLTHTNSSISSELHSLFGNMTKQNNSQEVIDDNNDSHDSNTFENSTDKNLSTLNEMILANVKKFTSVEDVSEMGPLSDNTEKINNEIECQNFGNSETMNVDSGHVSKYKSELHGRVSQKAVDDSLVNTTNEKLLKLHHSLLQSSVHDINKNKPTIGVSHMVNIKKETPEPLETLPESSVVMGKEQIVIHNDVNQSAVNSRLENFTGEKLSQLHHILSQPSVRDIDQAETPNGISEAPQNNLVQSTAKGALDQYTGEGLSTLHPVERPYSCSLCKKGFSKKTYLEQHMYTHGDISQRPFQCHMCSNGFTKRSHYERHLKTHSKVMEFFCTICGKGFFEKRGLTRHTQTMHSGIRPFQCSICKQEFKKEHLLQKHMLSHTNSNSSMETTESHSLFGSVVSQNNILGNLNDNEESHSSMDASENHSLFGSILSQNNILGTLNNNKDSHSSMEASENHSLFGSILSQNNILGNMNNNKESHPPMEASESHSLFGSKLHQNDILENRNSDKESHNSVMFKKIADELQTAVHPMYYQPSDNGIDQADTPIVVPEIVIYNDDECNNPGTLETSTDISVMTPKEKMHLYKSELH